WWPGASPGTPRARADRSHARGRIVRPAGAAGPLGRGGPRSDGPFDPTRRTRPRRAPPTSRGSERRWWSRNPKPGPRRTIGRASSSYFELWLAWVLASFPRTPRIARRAPRPPLSRRPCSEIEFRQVFHANVRFLRAQVVWRNGAQKRAPSRAAWPTRCNPRQRAG